MRSILAPERPRTSEAAAALATITAWSVWRLYRAIDSARANRRHGPEVDGRPPETAGREHGRQPA
ncbi:MAG: hypothetical protein ACRCYU_17245 [Nocardioides sp.]